MKRIAYYGGSFDPVHRGHLEIANALTKSFDLDEFVFIPAFHAPHKARLKPTSAFQRFAMLALATANEPNLFVSRFEVENPDKPYTIQTVTKILEQTVSASNFFIMGSDSWNEITTWRDWRRLIEIINIIIVERPGSTIENSYPSKRISTEMIDLRGEQKFPSDLPATATFLTDIVSNPISSTKIRNLIRQGDSSWEKLVNSEVANYIEKYKIY